MTLDRDNNYLWEQGTNFSQRAHVCVRVEVVYGRECLEEALKLTKYVSVEQLSKESVEEKLAKSR